MVRQPDAWQPRADHGEPPPVPPGVDPEVPSPARLYDYYLGGTINYPADQEAAERIRRDLPEISDMAWANRGFHQRAAKWLAAEAGMSQFIDIGSGLPTQGNTHQVVREIAADARVVYVDNDPMVRAYAGQLLNDSRLTTFVFADLCEPDRIVGPAASGADRLHRAGRAADERGAAFRRRRSNPGAWWPGTPGPGARQFPRAVPRDRGRCARAGGADRAVGVREGHPEHLPASPGRGGTLLRRAGTRPALAGSGTAAGLYGGMEEPTIPDSRTATAHAGDTRHHPAALT